MSKPNPYLKKATGPAKGPASIAPKKRHGLGRGLDNLLSSPKPDVTVVAAPAPAAAAVAAPGTPLELNILDIERSPFQPRRDFKEEELRELAESLKNNGLVQPPTVRKNAAGRYELIAGERRLRAAQLAHRIEAADEEVLVIQPHRARRRGNAQEADDAPGAVLLQVDLHPARRQRSGRKPE